MRVSAAMKVCTAALVAPLLVTLCADEPLPDLPRSWESTTDDGGRITLRDDGTGTFINVPHGTGEDCTNGGDGQISGDFTWRPVGNQEYIAQIDGYEVSFGPASQPVMDLTWDKLVVSTCEGKEDLYDPITTYVFTAGAEGG